MAERFVSRMVLDDLVAGDTALVMVDGAKESVIYAGRKEELGEIFSFVRQPTNYVGDAISFLLWETPVQTEVGQPLELYTQDAFSLEPLAAGYKKIKDLVFRTEGKLMDYFTKIYRVSDRKRKRRRRKATSPLVQAFWNIQEIKDKERKKLGNSLLEDFELRGANTSSFAIYNQCLTHYAQKGYRPVGAYGQGKLLRNNRKELLVVEVREKGYFSVRVYRPY